MSEFVRVATTADIPPGHGIVAEANGTPLAIFNVDGTIHAINNTCCHRDGPLGEGELEGNIVTCPWHAWRFSIQNGTWLDNPQSKLCQKTYEVQVIGDDVCVSVDTAPPAQP